MQKYARTNFGIDLELQWFLKIIDGKFKNIKWENYIIEYESALYSNVAEPKPTTVWRDSMTFSISPSYPSYSSFSESVSGPCVHANTRVPRVCTRRSRPLKPLFSFAVVAVPWPPVYSSVLYKCDLLDLSDFGGRRSFQKLPGGRARRTMNTVHNTLT